MNRETMVAALRRAALPLLVVALAGTLGLSFERSVFLASFAFVASLLWSFAVSDVEDSPISSVPVDRAAARHESPTELFEAILGTLLDGVFVVDSRQRILYVNRAARDLLDLGEKPVAGKLVSEVSRSSPLQKSIDDTLRTREQQYAEIALPRQKLTVTMSASSLQLGEEAGVLIVLHDITALRKLERMRRDFVSNVSHELKTPLTSIQAYADTLLDGGLEDADNNRMFLQRIVDQADRLRVLIMDLLRLARLESDDENWESAPVDLAGVIESCMRDRSPVAQSKGLQLVVDPLPSGLSVQGDAEGIRTILDNLVDNAINYTPAGGKVSISASRTEVEVGISVTDTGVGIPREHQERIFERFYRVDRARSRAVGGTGLGLSIVKHLLQTLNGRIVVESETSRGSRFTFWLPREVAAITPDSASSDSNR